MKKRTSWLLVAATTAILLQGCNSAAQPNTQPTPAPAGQATEQPAAQPQAGNATNTQPATKPSTDNPATPGNGAKQGAIDLTPELQLNPAMRIGTTTFAELEKKFGSAEEVKDHNTAFRTGLNNPSSKFPKIVNTSAKFHINPVTGEKMDQTFPYYFTKDDKKVLVQSQIILKRGDLVAKQKNHTVTLEDVKKAYGDPLRETPVGLEYYDFEHKIAIHVMMLKKGKLSCMLSRYDLLYGENIQDLQKHEEKIRELAAKLNQ